MVKINIESKRKAAGWVIVAILINVASIGIGFAIYDGRWDCLAVALSAVCLAAVTAWRLAWWTSCMGFGLLLLRLELLAGGSHENQNSSLSILTREKWYERMDRNYSVYLCYALLDTLRESQKGQREKLTPALPPTYNPVSFWRGFLFYNGLHR